MKIRIILASLLITGFAALVFLMIFGTGSAPGQPAPQFIQSEDCRECHPGVYAEWESSWHAKAWTDPFVREQSDNFKNKDCIPCHAPRPVFERGFRPGERVVERASGRGDGVDCLSCHKLPEGGIAAASRDPEGPCGPVYRPELASTALCAPCHNQHDTVNEWLDAPAHLKGENCNGCHMPVVERAGRNGGPPRRGRDHSYPGGRSLELVRNAFTLYHEIREAEGSRHFVVRIVNDRTAHNLPADSRHRALDLILTFYRPGGLAFEAMDGERGYGQESGTYRLRFRNPYRSEQKENTQILSGNEAVLDVPVPERAQRAVIQVIYKLTPFLLDEEGISVVHMEVPL